MAKENKKAALSMEERLDAALVPDWEQPYKVPANWCWTYIRAGFNVSSSKRVHKNDWRSDGVPFYRTRELVKLSERGFVDNELFITSELYEQFKKNYGVPSPGDLLISGVGTIGVPYVIDDERPFYFKDGNIIWFKNRGVFFPQYIYYLYKSTFMFNQLHAMSAGTTVDTYTIINAENTMLPLPPYAEQQRIVDRIESLFAKLDEAKEKAQEVVDGYDTRRAAILHKAFTGELIGLSVFNTVTLGSIVDTIRIGPFGSALHKEDYIVGGTPIINPKHIVNQKIVPDEKTTISKEKAEELAGYKLKIGDIVMGRRGEMGRSAPVTEEQAGWLCGTGSLIIRLQEGYDASFYSQIIASHSSVQYLEENCVGSTMNNLNEKIVKGLPVPNYSKEDQQRIVTILTALFEKEQRAIEAAEQVIAQIDTMKKSILARAFRGELGTNDPTDESASELIKEILNIEKTPTKRAKAITIPKEFSANLKTELEKRIVKLFYQKDTKELPIKDIMTVSSKTFDVLDCLRSLEQRQLITKLENGKYRLMG